MTINQTEQTEKALAGHPGDRKGNIPRSMVTIYHVAEKAGVSTATVSRILAGFVSFNVETRRKVLEAVGETGYRPNLQAREIALRKK